MSVNITTSPVIIVMYVTSARHACPDCAVTKIGTPKKSPLKNVKVGSPLQMVAVDFLGTFPESNTRNYYYILVIPNHKAMTVTYILTHEFIFCFSPPQQLHSDQRKQFVHKSLLKPQAPGNLKKPLPYITLCLKV